MTISNTAISLSIANLRGSDLAPLFCVFGNNVEAQPAYVEVTEDGAVEADYSGDVGPGVPAYVWHQRTLRFKVSPSVSGSALANFLESTDALVLLQRIHNGHTIDWDGNNQVGTLDEDAIEAVEALESDLADLPEVFIFTAEDFAFENNGFLESWPAEKTLDEAVAALELSALGEHQIDGDFTEVLLDRAASLFDDEDDKIAPNHIAALLAAGRITQDQIDERASA